MLTLNTYGNALVVILGKPQQQASDVALGARKILQESEEKQPAFTALNTFSNLPFLAAVLANRLFILRWYPWNSPAPVATNSPGQLTN